MRASARCVPCIAGGVVWGRLGLPSLSGGWPLHPPTRVAARKAQRQEWRGGRVPPGLPRGGSAPSRGGGGPLSLLSIILGIHSYPRGGGDGNKRACVAWGAPWAPRAQRPRVRGLCRRAPGPCADAAKGHALTRGRWGGRARGRPPPPPTGRQSRNVGGATVAGAALYGPALCCCGAPTPNAHRPRRGRGCSEKKKNALGGADAPEPPNAACCPPSSLPPPLHHHLLLPPPPPPPPSPHQVTQGKQDAEAAPHFQKAQQRRQLHHCPRSEDVCQAGNQLRADILRLDAHRQHQPPRHV